MSFLSDFLFGKTATENISRSVLNEILEKMREGVIVVGRDTRIVASNRAAYDAFARKNGALENKRLSEVVRDLSLHEAFRKALEENVSSDIHLEIPLDKLKYDVRVAPIAIDKSNGAIGIFYDVTQVEMLERVRQEFFSNISHELRTPLTSILAFVETLEDGAIEDEENNRRFLGVIRKNAQRMRRLIDDILELSSIETGNITIEPKKINLNALVEEVFTNLSGKAKERGIALKNKIPKDAFVFADVVRLEQMLTNLIDNAVKFNSEKGSVNVFFEEREGKSVVSISDTGEGISNDHLQRIFERFYRADRARSREVGGTGLGLAIVKHLARLHGGEIAVQSIIGKGSTFTIELPMKIIDS